MIKATLQLPIGSIFNTGLTVHRKNARFFVEWAQKRSKNLKPRKHRNLIIATFSYYILQKLLGISTDVETCYSYIFPLKAKIERLQLITFLNGFGFAFLIYFFLLLIVALGIGLIGLSFSIGGIPLLLLCTLLIIAVIVVGFRTLSNALREMKFALIDLIYEPDRKPKDALKQSSQFVRNSNIWQLDILVNIITSNILSVLFILGLLFYRVIGGWIFLLTLPIGILIGFELQSFRIAMDTSCYFVVKCYREGLDLNLRREAKETMDFLRKITLLTPESVELEFSLAGIGNRALALLIDYLILFVVLSVVGFIWIVVGLELEDVSSQWFNAFMSILTSVIYGGYFVYFETVWSGQTPGKRFAKIRVIQENGRPVGLQQSTLRALLRVFDDFFSFGTLFIIFKKNEKRLGDIVAQTIVIQEGQRTNPVKLKISDRAEVSGQLLASAGVIDLIQPDDFAVIKEYLQRRDNFSASIRSKVEQRLISQLQEHLGMAELFETMNKEEILEGIYTFYQKQSQGII